MPEVNSRHSRPLEAQLATLPPGGHTLMGMSPEAPQTQAAIPCGLMAEGHLLYPTDTTPFLLLVASSLNTLMVCHGGHSLL